ncbi:unnamed protein product [Closterium sp. Yama58-4]|nr:unnamed protein product [Closterium sp. Yama58-4]
MEAVESERIHESCFQDSHWVRGHGIHRLFCETNLHPHQQHYCRIVIKIPVPPWWIDRFQQAFRDIVIGADWLDSALYVMCVSKLMYFDNCSELLHEMKTNSTLVQRYKILHSTL